MNLRKIGVLCAISCFINLSAMQQKQSPLSPRFSARGLQAFSDLQRHIIIAVEKTEEEPRAVRLLRGMCQKSLSQLLDYDKALETAHTLLNEQNEKDNPAGSLAVAFEDHIFETRGCLQSASKSFSNVGEQFVSIIINNTNNASNETIESDIASFLTAYVIKNENEE